MTVELSAATYIARLPASERALSRSRSALAEVLCTHTARSERQPATTSSKSMRHLSGGMTPSSRASAKSG